MATYTANYSNLNGFYDGLGNLALRGVLYPPQRYQSIGFATTHAVGGGQPPPITGLLPFNSIAGNFILVYLVCRSDPGFFLPDGWSISDTLGNTYTLVQQQNDGIGGTNHLNRTYIAENVAAGANTVSVSWTQPGGSTNTNLCVLVEEYGNGPASGVVVDKSQLINSGTITNSLSLTASGYPLQLIAYNCDANFPSSGDISSVANFTVSNNASNNTTSPCSIRLFTSFPLLTCGSPPDGFVGVAYSAPPGITGGFAPYLYSIASGSIPPGTTLDTATGIVSGTPTLAGTYSYTLHVEDLNANASTSPGCSILIDSNLEVSCNNPPEGQAGQPYDHFFTSTGGVGSLVWFINPTDLPPGLTLNTATGELTGTPTLEGVYPFTVEVTDNGGAGATAHVDCSITIGVSIVCSNPPDGTVGVPYTYTFPLIGGTGPFDWEIIDGALPPGLTLGLHTGTVSGVPTLGGDYGFTIQVTDAVDATATCTILIHVPATIGNNVYTLKDYKLTDDDYGRIYPWYVTYFCPTFEQEGALSLGGGRKMLSYLTAFIDANSYIHLGCNLTVTFYCDTLLNPWALTVQRTLAPNAIFDMECGAAVVAGQRIAVKFESSPFVGATDNAFSLSKVVFFIKTAARLPIRGSAS